MTTPIRTVRIPDKLWNAVRKKAAKRNETVSAVIVRLLHDFIEKD
jgi:hypothetical protein